MPQSDDAKDRLEERDWLMWDAHVKGATQREIAEQWGISQSSVSLRLKAVRESIPPEEKDHVRRRYLDELMAMSRELWMVVDNGPIPAYSNGRRMTMPNEAAPDDPDAPGEQVWDHSGRITAMKEIRAIQERGSKLLGLDSAEKQEITAVVEHKPREVLDLISAARERTAAQEAQLRGDGQQVEAEARDEYGPA